jgi:hypothetical protein
MCPHRKVPKTKGQVRIKYTLLISRIFNLIDLDSGGPKITEISLNETISRGTTVLTLKTHLLFI